jgi:hypothetical protein
MRVDEIPPRGWASLTGARGWNGNGRRMAERAQSFLGASCLV